MCLPVILCLCVLMSPYVCVYSTGYLSLQLRGLSIFLYPCIAVSLCLDIYLTLCVSLFNLYLYVCLPASLSLCIFCVYVRVLA